MTAVSKGRPKSEEKKQQIFKAAVHLFLSKGFDATSMDEIADRAGVSKQTVYSHFQNKEQLFSHCVTHKCDCYELSPEFMNPDVPVESMLRKVAHQFSDMLMSPEAIKVKRILCASAETQPDLSAIFFEAGPQHMINTLTRYLDDQARAGRLAIADAGVAARQFLYMIHGEAHMRELLNVPGDGPSQEQITHYVDACVDLFLKAYAPSH